ncbi:MAG: type II toxin-antitoxin system Phd/YefM family antitoxin [Actinomycetota bacterium]
MTEVASRELRNHTRSLLNRVEAGEQVTITVDGRPVALLQPLGRRLKWMNRDQFFSAVLSFQADSELRQVLYELAPDTTDDIE